MVKPKSSQSRGCTHIHKKPKKFKQMFFARKLKQLEQEMSVDGGIHATRDHNNVRSGLRNAKKNCVGPAIQNKRCGMLTYGVVLLHDNVSLHTRTAACTPALLDNFNWELFSFRATTISLPT
jgi:hypothetical protein